MRQRLPIRASGAMVLTLMLVALVVSPVALAADSPFRSAAGHWQLPDVRPDARIRLGSSGPFTGNDIYNATGANQKVIGSAPRSSTITYEMSMQNDSTTDPDGFTVKATGAASSEYVVKYFDGTTDITSDVVAGTYVTPLLIPGGKHVITARVKVKSNATVGSKVTRLVTITSAEGPPAKDAVKLVAKRA